MSFGSYTSFLAVRVLKPLADTVDSEMGEL